MIFLDQRWNVFENEQKFRWIFLWQHLAWLWENIHLQGQSYRNDTAVVCTSICSLRCCTSCNYRGQRRCLEDQSQFSRIFCCAGVWCFRSIRYSLQVTAQDRAIRRWVCWHPHHSPAPGPQWGWECSHAMARVNVGQIVRSQTNRRFSHSNSAINQEPLFPKLAEHEFSYIEAGSVSIYSFADNSLLRH